MSLTVLDPHCYEEYDSYQQIFDLNNDNYVFYSNKDHSEQVDILICNHFYHPTLNAHEIIKQYNYRCSVFMDTKHGWENQITGWMTKIDGSLHDYTITIAAQPGISHPRLIFFDFLFNRTKAYYLGHNWHPTTSKNYYESSKNYVIPTHPLPDKKNKIFVAPNDVSVDSIDPDSGQRRYRLKLVNLILEKYADCGYLGAWSINRKLKLWAQTDNIHARCIDDLSVPKTAYRPRGYSPPHSLYYEDTYISVYAETIEHGSTFIISEKTLDPLIKGHFILPFSNPGFINYAKTLYGFQFPTFIDYSYDEIYDNDLRFAAYANELDRLVHLSNWPELWIANQNIIKHNQQIFYDRPYHKIDFQSLLS